MPGSGRSSSPGYSASASAPAGAGSSSCSSSSGCCPTTSRTSCRAATPRPTPSPSSARCSSSPRSSCTSSATRSQARREGIEIAGIDLWFFGGIAQIKSDTESPGQEFRVAIAGPLVTLLIVGVCVGLGALIADFDRFLDVALLDPERTPTRRSCSSAGWRTINAFLLVFNLVPAFPLDGGRIARAAAWKLTGNRNSATRAAARVGQGFGYLLVAFGFWLLADRQPGERPVAAGPGDVPQLGGAADRPADRDLGAPGGSHRRGHHGPRAAVAERGHAAARRRGGVRPARPARASRSSTTAGASSASCARSAWRRTSPRAGPLSPPARRSTTTPASSRCGEDQTLQALLGSEGLRRTGAVAAVDGDGRLCGLVTFDQVRRALSPVGALTR